MKICNCIFFAINLFICTSCGVFYGEKHFIEFDCNKQDSITIQPPSGTYKCTIECKQNECNVVS